MNHLRRKIIGTGIGLGIVTSVSFCGACFFKYDHSGQQLQNAREIDGLNSEVQHKKKIAKEFIYWYSNQFVNQMKTVSSDMQLNLRRDGDIEITIGRYGQQHLMCLEYAVAKISNKPYSLDEIANAQFDNSVAAAVISDKFVDYGKVREKGEKAYKRWSGAWSGFYVKALQSDKPARNYKELFRNTLSPGEFDGLMKELAAGSSDFYDAVAYGTPGWLFVANLEREKMRKADSELYGKIREEIYGTTQPVR